MTITRHLIALYGGTLTLESQPDQGSTFHVHLPLPPLGEEMSLPLSDLEPVLLLISFSSQVGFNDKAYFSRVFHKATGHSPQDFRNLSKDG